MKVFLVRTGNESTWRDEFIKTLKIDYFAPIVDGCTLDDMDEEIWQRENCDFVLYVITPPMYDVYSIAEVVDDSNKRPNKTIFVFLREYGVKKFTYGQYMPLIDVATMIRSNGGRVFKSLWEAANFLNKQTGEFADAKTQRNDLPN